MSMFCVRERPRCCLSCRNTSDNFKNVIRVGLPMVVPLVSLLEEQLTYNIFVTEETYQGLIIFIFPKVSCEKDLTQTQECAYWPTSDNTMRVTSPITLHCPFTRTKDQWTPRLTHRIFSTHRPLCPAKNVTLVDGLVH